MREGADDDLLDDASWERYRERLAKGEYGFVLAGTPCSTHSAAPRGRGASLSKDVGKATKK